MIIENKLIAVTGASGMLGVYIVRALLAAGARVRGVVRNPKKAEFLAREGVEFATADLEDRAALTEAFRGCDAIIANAALYSNANKNWDDNFRANKVGTENVYEAAGSAGRMMIFAVRDPGCSVDKCHGLVIVLEFVGFGDHAIFEFPTAQLTQKLANFQRLERRHAALTRLAFLVRQVLSCHDELRIGEW